MNRLANKYRGSLYNKSMGAGGEAVKRKNIVLKEEMGIFDYIAGVIRKHPKLSAAGGIALFGLGLYATNSA